jgi:DNA modification methylase
METPTNPISFGIPVASSQERGRLSMVPHYSPFASLPMSIESLPNPKPLASKDVAWYRFYAMFSDAFATRVISDADLPADATVLDPWLGVGTTVAAAAAAGFKGIGIDVNPVMVTVSKGRGLDRGAASDAVALLERHAKRSRPRQLVDDDPLLEWYDPNAAEAIRKFERDIRTLKPNLFIPCASDFLLTILFEVAWNLASTNRSKNPTWMKKPRMSDRVVSTREQIIESFMEAAHEKIELCPDTPYRHRPDVQLGTSVNLGLPDAVADLVLTSPPYCTRIDYAVTTSVELAVLGRNAEQVDALRDRTMGTSTVRRDKPTLPSETWGPCCWGFLEQVRKHPSKASNTYYYKNFLQYFDDLWRSLCQINRCTKPGGRVVIVVQDSYYKGIRTDLAQIVTEIGESFGWRLHEKKPNPVSRSMRLVNTRSRFYRANVACFEEVLWFKTAP